MRLGMDTAAVEGIARRMSAKAAQATTLSSSAGRLVRSSEQLWLGERADRWLADWMAQEVAIKRMGQFIEDLAEDLRQQAREQDRVSDQTGGARSAPRPSVSASDIGTPAHGRWGHAGDMAKLAGAAYGEERPPAGWRKVGDEELRAMGIDPSHFSNSLGFSASLFVSSEGKFTLAFRGTDDWKDWVFANRHANEITAQDRYALRLATELHGALGQDLEFTGHSLGGRLAAIAAISTGGRATTFDAAGVSSSAIRMASGGNEALVEAAQTSVTDYHVKGEVLNAVQHVVVPSAFGTHVELPAPPALKPLKVGPSGLPGHAGLAIDAANATSQVITGVADSVNDHSRVYLYSALSEKALDEYRNSDEFKAAQARHRPRGLPAMRL